MHSLINLKSKNTIYIFALMIITTVLLFFVTTTSPIRDINYLNYDSTIFYIIGRGIKYGYVPYLDLTDHKGIYIFLINYLAALISESNHLGLFIVHLLITYFTIIVVYKISDFVTKNPIINFFTTLTIVILYNNYFFSHGAVKCETFLMPFLYLSLYLFLKNDWGKKWFSKNMFIIGICAGVILFTKANSVLCLLPIVIYLVIISIMDKRYIDIIRLFISGMMGVIVGILPGLIYCIANNCLEEMIKYSYLYNITYSNYLFYVYKSYFDAIQRIFLYFMGWILLSIISIVAFYKLTNDKKLLIFYIPFVIFNNIASFMALRPFSYHANPLLLNVLFLIVFVYLVFEKKVMEKRKHLKFLYGLVISLLFIYSYILTWKYSELQNIRYKDFAKEVHQYFDEENVYIEQNKKSPVLVVGITLNIYNEFNVFPGLKNFCIPNMSNKDENEIYDEFINSLNSGSNEYVILSNNAIMIKDGFLEEVRSIMDRDYKLVLEYLGGELYKRK